MTGTDEFNVIGILKRQKKDRSQKNGELMDGITVVIKGNNNGKETKENRGGKGGRGRPSLRIFGPTETPPPSIIIMIM